MFDDYRKAVENKLESVLKPYPCEYSELTEAMSYSVCGGGKRIRPALMMEFAGACGSNPYDVTELAAALEMIHTYSLIHDDLPCMDDDDFRRGRQSCHKAFGEAMAVLAGDALLTDAFKVALSSEKIPSERLVKAVSVLAECAGTHGMIGGQVIDIKYENVSAPIEAIKEMYRLKTGALLTAAAKIGCIAAGADDGIIASAGAYAENIGLAFQIMDDILDMTGTADILGKPVGSDESSNKSTYVSRVGLEAAKADVCAFTNAAIKSLEPFGGKAESLKELAVSLSTRNK